MNKCLRCKKSELKKEYNYCPICGFEIEIYPEVTVWGEIKEVVILLRDISDTLKNSKIGKITFTVSEAAEFSGFNHWKIRELIEMPNTDFPFFKVGKKTFIDKNMLEKWIEKISEEHRQI